MITPDGIRYRVTHKRRWKIDPHAGQVWPPLAKGGLTLVEILGENDVVVAAGIATCRPDENYNRRLGRTIALGRALKHLGGPPSNYSSDLLVASGDPPMVVYASKEDVAKIKLTTRSDLPPSS